MTRYTLTVTTPDDPTTVEQQVRNALADQGFGILSEIDVQAALREKVGEDVGPYKILGACNPSLAYTAIGLDPDVGALLPCNILIRGNDQGGTDVVAADPRAMLAVADDSLGDVADDARSRIRAALETLGAESVA